VGRSVIGRLVSEVAAVLDEALGPRLEAAFVYGSVAARRATATSDVDCLVVTRDEVAGEVRAGVRERFLALQVRLGHTPDPQHPVELFSLQRCRDALASGAVQRALRDAAAGVLAHELLDGDDLEVVRALVGDRITVRSSRALDQLSSGALHAVREGLDGLPDGDRARACRALGLPLHLTEAVA